MKTENTQTIPARTVAIPCVATPKRADDHINRGTGAAELDRLAALPYPAFAIIVAKLLKRMGYRDVRMMGVMRGRNTKGGLDILARLQAPLTHATVAVQAKQYRDPVPRTYVDELRGAMLRLGASHGILLTTSRFSPAALEGASAAQGALPLRLVDGRELVRLLAEHGLPVALPDANPSARLDVHQAYQPHAPRGTSVPADSGVREVTALSADDRLSVTVRVDVPQPVRRLVRLPVRKPVTRAK